MAEVIDVAGELAGVPEWIGYAAYLRAKLIRDPSTGIAAPGE